MSKFLLLLSFLWVTSALGMIVIIWRKIPVLAQVSLKTKAPKTQPFFQLSKINIRSILLLPLKNFSFRKFTEKSLAKFHIFILKTENTTRRLRERLRPRPTTEREKTIQKDSSYWEKLKGR